MTYSALWPVDMSFFYAKGELHNFYSTVQYKINDATHAADKQAQLSEKSSWVHQENVSP